MAIQLKIDRKNPKAKSEWIGGVPVLAELIETFTHRDEARKRQEYYQQQGYKVTWSEK